MKYRFLFLPAFFLIIHVENLRSQDADINYYLKKIESGKKQEVIKSLPELKKQHPESALVLYLDALLTEDSTDAVHKFLNFSKKYPGSAYADDALFRVSAYYYSVGSYFAAREYLNRLKRKYPGSPYIKLAERNFPEKNEPGSALDIEKISETADKKNIPGEKNTSGQKNIPEQKKLKEDFKFTIQAGAFSNPENAAKLQKDFIKSGYFSEIKEKNIAGVSFKVVYMGKFKTEKEASEVLKIINERYSLSGKIITATR